ncbi:MAG: hypothetical protein NVS2B12_21130 [Ktedonobacteraceae bacterium]
MLFEGGQTPALYDFLHATCRGTIGGYLGAEVSTPLVWCAHVAQDEREQGAIGLTGLPELEGGDDDAFLVDFARQWHGPWRHTSDVGVVGAVGCETYQSGFLFALYEDRGDEGDVWQVAPTQKGIVQGDDVS